MTPELAAKWFKAEEEFLCPCLRKECDAPKAPARILLLYLDRARDMYGMPITITKGGGNRCAWYNNQPNVIGENPSEHVQKDGCLGCDISCVSSRERAKLLDAFRHAGISRVGIYARHLHVGVGDTVDEATFAPEVVWVGNYAKQTPA